MGNKRKKVYGEASVHDLRNGPRARINKSLTYCLLNLRHYKRRVLLCYEWA